LRWRFRNLSSLLAVEQKIDCEEITMNLLSPVTFPPSVKDEAAGSFESFPSVPPLVRPPSPRVAIKVRGKILFINLADVVSVHAEGNYVSLRGNNCSHLLRESISAVAERLEPYGFIRIHRSVLVNTAFVEEIQPYTTGEYGLRVRGGKEHTVTRTYKKNLKSLAEFWMGTGTFFSE
jgi:DNA-binding LytR/AlgR family response regulator